MPSTPSFLATESPRLFSTSLVSLPTLNTGLPYQPSGSVVHKHPAMQKLKRYSSCDPCKRARIGCNASSQGGGPCFNCTRKGIACTSIQNQRRSRPRQGGQIVAAGPSDAEEPSDESIPVGDEPDIDNDGNVPSSYTSIDPAATPVSETQRRVTRTQQALLLHETLWNIFTSLLEPRIGLWIGGSCCPFQSTKTVSCSMGHGNATIADGYSLLQH